MELNADFLIRIRKNVYKEEINNMKSNDEMVKLELTDQILGNFKDPKLKTKYENRIILSFVLLKQRLKLSNMIKTLVKNTKMKLKKYY